MKYSDKLKHLVHARGTFFMPTPDKPYFSFTISESNKRDTISEVGDDYIIIDYQFGTQVIPLSLFVLEA